MKLSSKEKIVKAAIKVFSRKGYDAASMREIALMARLTKPMIYYHFKNKKDLYLYILQKHLEEFYDRLQKILNSSAEHAAILSTVIDHYDQTFRNSPEVFNLLQRETTGSGYCVEFLIKKYFSKIHEQMVKFFKDGAHQGAFRPLLNYDLCSLTLVAILMFHFSQGRVVEHLSESVDKKISSAESIHAHIMSLFTG
jgi:AcrR family transcriptional regulator